MHTRFVAASPPAPVGPDRPLRGASRAGLALVIWLFVMVVACGSEPDDNGGVPPDTQVDVPLGDGGLGDGGLGDGGLNDGGLNDGGLGDAAAGDGAESDGVESDGVESDGVAPDGVAQVDSHSSTDAAADIAQADAIEDGDAAATGDTSQSADAADSSDGGGGAWTLPTCTTPTGAPGVAFGPKSGATLQISTAAVQPGKTYTMGLAATGAAGELYAEHAGTVYRSTDSGCSWVSVGGAPTSPMRMVGGVDARAYAFYDNGSALVRLQGKKVTVLTAPTANILGLGVHPTDPATVRIGGKTGQIWQNTTGGTGLWLKLGKAPGTSGSGYRVAFSPLNIDRVLYGGMTTGLALTTDGGKTWSPAKFVGAITPQKLNGMNAAFSPVEEGTVWAMAIDLNESLQVPSKTNGKHLWRSTDGGVSFSKVVAHLQANDVTLTNGVHLRPDATDAAVVRWAFGTCFSGYGTNLYRYDANAKKLSWVNHPIPGIVEIVHHPASPELLLLGLRADNNPQCP